MPKDEKFNPIAKLPILPGMDIANDEEVSNIIDSTYPPVPPAKVPDIEKDVQKPQIEIRLKPTEPEAVVVKEEEKSQLCSIRVIILVCLIALVIFGIFLTLTVIPKIFNNISNLSQSFGSLFVSNETATTTATSTVTNTPAEAPTYIPIVTTETPVAPIEVQQSSVQPTVITQSAQVVTPQVTKTPAKLVSNLISTDAIGNRVVVRFNIQNIGETTSGTWSFVATLPSDITPKYYSASQNPLAPKSGVIYTLEFTATEDLPIQISISQ